MKSKVFLGLLILLVILVFAVDRYADMRAEEEVKNILSRLELSGASFEGVDYRLLSGEVVVERLRIPSKGGTTEIERLTVREYGNDRMVLFAEGIRGERDELERDMKELGYTDPYMNFYLDARMDRDSKNLTVEDMSFEVPEAFRVSLSFSAGNITPDLITDLITFNGEDREELNYLVGRMAEIRFGHLKATFSDMGLRERLFEQKARKEGKTPEEVKEEILSSLEERATASEEGKEFLSSFRGFIRDGGSIGIAVKPVGELTMQELIYALFLSVQMKDPSPLFQRLDFSFFHTK